MTHNKLQFFDAHKRSRSKKIEKITNEATKRHRQMNYFPFHETKIDVGMLCIYLLFGLSHSSRFGFANSLNGDNVCGIKSSTKLTEKKAIKMTFFCGFFISKILIQKQNISTINEKGNEIPKIFTIVNFYDFSGDKSDALSSLSMSLKKILLIKKI